MRDGFLGGRYGRREDRHTVPEPELPPEFTAAVYEARRQQHDQEIRVAERAHDRSLQFELKLIEAATRDAQEAIKAALAINGGAAIGVLAFVGALASRKNINSQELTSLAYSVAWFALGVFAGGLMAAAAYFTNSFYSGHHGETEKLWEPPYLRNTERSLDLWHRGRICNWVAVTLGFISLAAFIAGLFFSGRALLNLTNAFS